MNQWLAENRYRSYPFEQNQVLPFPDTVIVSAQVVLATAFAVTDVTLTSVTASSGALALVFSIGSSVLTGYTLEGSIATGAAEEVRIALTVKHSSTAHPELGYGFLVIGQPGDAVSAVTTTGLTAVLDRSVIRYQVANQTLHLRVANTLRVGASTVTFTAGSPQSFGIQGLVAVIEEGCVERAISPTAQQEEVVPTVRGSTTSLVDIPNPGTTRSMVEAGSVTTITVTPATPVTTTPTIPTDRDADVVTGVINSQRVISAGYNVKLGGNVPANTVQISYQLAAGLGMDCSGVLGYTSAVRSAQCVKSINGVYPTGQDLTLTPDTGIAILSDQNAHRLIILVNPLNLTRVAP